MEYWYVYYKVARSELVAVTHRVRAMQVQLADATGVQANLVRRTEANDGRALDENHVTLMEVYEHIEHPARFQFVYDGAVAAADLGVEPTARRVERFEDF